MSKYSFNSRILLEARGIIAAGGDQSREDLLKGMEKWKSSNIVTTRPFITTQSAIAVQKGKASSSKQELIDELTHALDIDSQDGIFNVAEKAALGVVNGTVTGVKAAGRVVEALDARERCGFSRVLPRYVDESDVNTAFKELVDAAKAENTIVPGIAMKLRAAMDESSTFDEQ